MSIFHVSGGSAAGGSASGVHAPIVLFCDFGLPYTGQMKARLLSGAPQHPIVDLFWDIPAHDICAGSVLLAAHAGDFPEGSTFVCVVDPGVGSNARKPGAVFAGGRWFIGPLNGLFEHTLRRWPEGARAFEIVWQPPSPFLSATFHGRDLFAPIAARVAREDLGALTPVSLEDIRHTDFPDDVAETIYADGFGNLMTGIRALSIGACDGVEIAGRVLPRRQTFAEGESGSLFVYENAVGLMEVSAVGGNAQDMLGVKLGSCIKIITS